MSFVEFGKGITLSTVTLAVKSKKIVLYRIYSNTNQTMGGGEFNIHGSKQSSISMA